MNKRNRVLFTIAITGSFFFAQPAAGQNPGKTWMQYASPEEAGFSSEKLKSVVELYEKNGASALMVVYDGKVLLWKGDIARRYDCHSMRKSLISALYGIYKEKGNIDIRMTLKDLAIDDSEKLTDIEKSATIQDLLKSRSGIFIPAFGETKSMQKERPARGSHPPNTFYYYNNWDFNVLGAIFQRVTGHGLFEAFDETLARPLEMEDFRTIDGRFWRDSTRQTIYPKYDIKLTARDLARFGILYCNDGRWNDRPIVQREWIAESITPFSTMDRGTYKEAYGYLWWISVLDDSIPMYYASGAGGHFLAVVPKYKLVIAKRHDTFGNGAGDSKSGMYVRRVINAQTSAPSPKPKLIPLTIETPQQRFLELPESTLKNYEQQIPLDGRMRKIEYGKFGLVFDEWFVLHPVTGTKFYIEDLEKYMYFTIEQGKPVFSRIE